ncbi:MAG TPA: hypothetical protein VMH83_05315 [Candidatus Acidoferrum sp.]|nr:hypothetical protein [Candidatus Acidoferrum sp.]
MKRLSPIIASLALLASSLANAHPGHGFGPISHALDHALWNFLGFAAVGALLLLIGRLPSSIRRRSDDNDDDGMG